MPDPDHSRTTTSPGVGYKRYFTQLQHLERLLYRHRRYRLLGVTLLITCTSLGIFSHQQGAPNHSLVLSVVGMMLSVALMGVSNARPSHNHLKVTLLIERMVSPGFASPLPRESVVAALGHTRRFVRLIDDWIDAEIQRCLMESHHQKWDRSHGL